MEAISTVVPSGATWDAARSSMELKEARRRLPLIPMILPMKVSLSILSGRYKGEFNTTEATAEEIFGRVLPIGEKAKSARNDTRRDAKPNRNFRGEPQRCLVIDCRSIRRIMKPLGSTPGIDRHGVRRPFSRPKAAILECPLQQTATLLD